NHRRRINRNIRPGLKMHCLGRADTDQDSQHLSTRSSQCHRGVETVATLFNGWKVESSGIRDRLQEIRITCIRIGPGNCRVLIYEQARDRLREDMVWIKIRVMTVV